MSILQKNIWASISIMKTKVGIERSYTPVSAVVISVEDCLSTGAKQANTHMDKLWVQANTYTQ